jgi:hypothetical protein
MNDNYKRSSLLQREKIMGVKSFTVKAEEETSRSETGCPILKKKYHQILKKNFPAIVRFNNPIELDTFFTHIRAINHT